LWLRFVVLPRILTLTDIVNAVFQCLLSATEGQKADSVAATRGYNVYGSVDSRTFRCRVNVGSDS
jgi:hypothetical protein